MVKYNVKSNVELKSHSYHVLQRNILWSNTGIRYKNLNGLKTIVEKACNFIHVQNFYSSKSEMATIEVFGHKFYEF